METDIKNKSKNIIVLLSFFLLCSSQVFAGVSVKNSNAPGTNTGLLVKDALRTNCGANCASIIVQSKGTAVLLTGSVQTPKLKILATEIAWGAQPSEVNNLIKIVNTAAVKDKAKDLAATAILRTKLISDPDINPTKFSIEVLNGKIHVFGITANSEELHRVIEHARRVRFTNRVINYVQIRSNAAPPPPIIAEQKPMAPPEVKKKPPKIKKTAPPLDDDKILTASSGSGFAVSSDGYVVTNHHVINGCAKVFIHTNGKAMPSDLVAYDRQNDIALLKARFKPEAVLPMSNKRPELLQKIYVAGYPFGKKVSSSVKVTSGIVSSLTGVQNNHTRIQIDAAVQSGNSGGPILGVDGNVVGVAVSKLDLKFALENLGSIPENTNFGIKSSVVASILDSNGVTTPPANQEPITTSELGKRISKGTFYISCGMTMTQIEEMRSKKVMFKTLE